MKPTSLAALLGAAVVAAFLCFSGGSQMDRQGWAYACPSAWTIFTSSSFIHIKPNLQGDFDNPPTTGSGQPDGRRVFYKCKASAGRNIFYSVFVLFISVAGALYLQFKPSQGLAPEVSRLRPKSIPPAARVEPKSLEASSGDMPQPHESVNKYPPPLEVANEIVRLILEPPSPESLENQARLTSRAEASIERGDLEDVISAYSELAAAQAKEFGSGHHVTQKTLHKLSFWQQKKTSQGSDYPM